jgi:tryptophan synthase alpha chain
MTRITKLFERLKAENRAGLIAYITAGDPSPDRTPALVLALERGGADLIELGVPFSDPIADGPVIQRGSERALKAGTTIHSVLEIAKEIRKTSQVPMILFSYLNPLLHYGFDKLAKDAVDAGIDGCLITDLSVEEAAPYTDILKAAGLATVFLAAPTSTERRLGLVAKYSSGFVYLVSRTGVTGERDSVSASAAPLVEAMRKITNLPLAVGFGISTPEHAEAVGRIADAAIVGTAVEKVVEECAGSAELELRLETLARELTGGLRRSR